MTTMTTETAILIWIQNESNDYNYCKDYRDSNLDLDLDLERFSEFVTSVTQLTITDKLQNLNHDIEG